MKKLLPYKLFLPILLFGLAFSLVSIGAIIEEQKGDNLTLDDTFVNDEFGIFGPDELCLYYGSIIGDFSGGGLDTDVFAWRILDESGNVVVEREGAFQIFSYTFSIEGIYTIELNIRRGTNQVFSSSKEIIINPGVDLIIQNSYLICDGDNVELTLIDPQSPNLEDFIIEWKNELGEVIDTGNTIRVESVGTLTAEFYTKNELGEVICPYSVSTNVRLPKDLSLSSDVPSGEICEGFNTVRLDAGNNISGAWFYSLNGSGERYLLGEGSKTSFRTNTLLGPGFYDFIFVVNDFDNRFCKDEEKIQIKINPEGDFIIESIEDVGECGGSDGVISFRSITNFDRVRLRKENQLIQNFFDVKAGDLLVISGLSAGTYNLTSFLGECTKWTSPQINFKNNDEAFFGVTTIDETCSESGTDLGKIILDFQNGPASGKIKLFNSIGILLPEFETNVLNQEKVELDVPAGFYLVEFEDEISNCVYIFQDSPNPDIPGLVTVRRKDQVNFEVEDVLNICESYDFIPRTGQELKFKLVFPDGTIIEENYTGSFILDQEGEYTILGSLIDESLGLCPRETTFFVNITEPVPYDPVLKSEDCFGNKTYEAELYGVNLSNVNIRWFNQNDEIVGQSKFLFPTSYGEFKLDVQPVNSEACPISPKVFMVDKPVFEVEVEIFEVQYCHESRYSILNVESDFDEADFFEWIFIDRNGNSFDLTQFDGDSEIRIEEYGFYEVVVYNANGCEIGRELKEVVELIDVAEFNIPDELIVCENYNLNLDTSLDIEFIVTFPSGEQMTVQRGILLYVDQEGEYVIESKALDENDPLCRLIKRLNVTIVQPVTFEPELLSEDCEGNLVYTANVFGEDPELLDFYWYAPNGDLISQDQVLQPSLYGEFQLDVRRKGSLECPGQIKSILIEEPVISLDVTLDAQPTTICPDLGFTFISINADLERVEETIKWFYTDAQGNRVERDEFENEPDIVVQDVGLFEVEVYNHIGCLLGSDQVEIQVSVDEVRPFTEEEYVFCLSFGEAPEINPGEFRLYEWYLDGRLVHEESTLRPTEAGEYTLTVTSFEGCRYTTEFTVREVCELQLAYPTAIEHGNPFKNFVIYPNYLVDELSVWVYNKWGQLLFYCTDSALFDKKETCEWDGTIEGQNIPAGTYAVKIQYKNRNEEGYKSVFSSITVLE